MRHTILGLDPSTLSYTQAGKTAKCLQNRPPLGQWPSEDMVTRHALTSTGLRFVFLAADPYPPVRPDVATLFGRELVARGHRITWVLASKEPAPAGYDAQWAWGPLYLGAKRRGSNVLVLLWNRWLDLRNDLRLASILAGGSYDFVQLKDKFLSAIPILLLARRHRLPFFYWLSYPYPEEADTLAAQTRGLARIYQLIRSRLFHFVLYKVVLPGATHVFVQSERMRVMIVAQGISADKMTAMPMGVSLIDVPPPPEPSAALDGKTTRAKLVYLGTLSHLRHLGFLLRVFARVHSRHPNTTLLFVGAGNCPQDEAALHAEATRLGIQEHFTITGQLPRQDAWSHVYGADICLSYFHPSPILDVASPTKVIEYLALNKVVVANDHPEQHEVLTRSGAGISVAAEEGAFADAVLYLLDHPEEAKRMGERGRAFVAQYRDYPVLANVLEGTYRTLLHRLSADTTPILQQET